jgi:hypothetical protein
MTIADSAGYAVAGANAKSLAALEDACHELRCFIRDPVATVNGALEESPQLVMGHVLKGYLHLLGTEPAGIPVARQALSGTRPRCRRAIASADTWKPSASSPRGDGTTRAARSRT